jgi:hypothetical protein
LKQTETKSTTKMTYTRNLENMFLTWNFDPRCLRHLHSVFCLSCLSWFESYLHSLGPSPPHPTVKLCLLHSSLSRTLSKISFPPLNSILLLRDLAQIDFARDSYVQSTGVQGTGLLRCTLPPRVHGTEFTTILRTAA